MPPVKNLRLFENSVFKSTEIFDFLCLRGWFLTLGKLFKELITYQLMMKLVYVVKGFGEYAQAESFALYTKTKRDQNIFITDDAKLVVAIRGAGFDTLTSKDTENTKKLIKKINPDVLFLCNSKTVFMYNDSILKEPPSSPRPFIASFDSNWLFLDDKRLSCDTPKWIDLIFAVMPKAIFNKGLYKNGGHYKISKIFNDNLFCSGFIPSGSKISQAKKKKIRKKLGIKKDEKLIYSYFGTREKFIIKNYLKSIEKIVDYFKKENKKIKVFIKLTKKQKIPDYDWLITKYWITEDEFIGYIGSSDLVIQHHGLGSLPKVIRNQVPVICIVPDVKKEYPYYKHSPFYEIEPFRKLGLCYSIPYSFSKKILKERIIDLLYNPIKKNNMKKAHNKYFEKGEQKAYKKLIEELKKKYMKQIG